MNVPIDPIDTARRDCVPNHVDLRPPLRLDLAQFREMPVLLLCGLIMISGFFNFVLPRSGGVLVSIMSVMLYASLSEFRLKRLNKVRHRKEEL